MTGADKPEDGINWELTTWEGSRREAMRHWAALPLERIVAALEEMQEVSEALSHARCASASVVSSGEGTAAKSLVSVNGNGGKDG